MPRQIKAALLGFAMAVAISAPAAASTDILADGDLVNRAATVFANKEPPSDRILGIHHGQMVVLDVRCADVCPNYTVRIVHYAGAPNCTQLGGDVVSVDVPRSITSGPEQFCIPHILVSRRLYADKPYQR